MRALLGLMLVACGGKAADSSGGAETGSTAPTVAEAALSCALRPEAPLLAECSVALPEAAAVELVLEDDVGEVRRFASAVATSHTVALWGLPADSALTVRAEGVDVEPVALTTPAVLGAGAPPPLDRLQLRAAWRPGEAPDGAPVVVDVACEDNQSESVLLAVDRRGRVVWTADPGGPVRGLAVTGPESLSAIVDNDRVLTWSLAGAPVVELPFPGCNGGEGPCPHHALGADDAGLWYASGTADAASYAPWGLAGCEEKAEYVVDGLIWVDGPELPFAELGYTPDALPPPDLDPAQPQPGCTAAYWDGVLGSPEPPIDYTHANALDLVDGQALVSLKSFDQVFLLDVAARELVWRLHGSRAELSDFPVPLTVAPSVVEHADPTFAGQHDTRLLPDGRVQIYDNGGAGDVSRILRVDASGAEAVIDEVYTFVDDDDGTWADPAPLYCSSKGGATTPDNGHPVVACRTGQVMELDRADGTIADGPRWFLNLSCGEVEARGLFRPVMLP